MVLTWSTVTWLRYVVWVHVWDVFFIDVFFVLLFVLFDPFCFFVLFDPFFSFFFISYIY